MHTHSVIIASCGRNTLLRALESVASQRRRPDRILVIDDSPQPDIECLRKLGQELALNLEVLANRRTKGASGAWNTGLDHLARNTPTPCNMLVSILDDDDYWDAEYLHHVNQAFEMGVDVVAGTLSRRDETTPEGLNIRPPKRLSADDFLVGNPGIQGSNLSAWLQTLLQAGMFNEALESCTDRDLCIRLADLGASYRPAPLAVAHHDCLHGEPRLSDPNSPAKRRGLDTFYAIHRMRMTPDQERQFHERALRLFGWTPPSAPAAPAVDSAGPIHSTEQPEPLGLVVGIIVDGNKPQRCLPLIDGLARLALHPLVQFLEVVLLENGSEGGFAQVVSRAGEKSLRVWPVGMTEQVAAFSATPVQAHEVTRHKPIAIARTLLQRFVFEVSHARNYAPAWILDDDYRLPESADELVAAMISCRDNGIDVALGGNSGAAPVPTSSLLRTQLVDIVHLLTWARRRQMDDHFPDPTTTNRAWLADRRDVHYDLSHRETDRLETPFLPVTPGRKLKEAVTHILRSAERIFAGEAITRPVAEPAASHPENANTSCWRGGNTFITDTNLLRDIPNMSPRVNGRPTRRSDMIWAANAHYRFGKSVKAFRLPMRHDRSTERTDENDTQRLVDDILGYGFFTAYEEAIKYRRENSSFTLVERQSIHKQTQKYALERLAAYRLSYWRITGLKIVLDKLVASSPWWLSEIDQETINAFDRFRTALARIEEQKALREVEHLILTGLAQGEFDNFLSDMDRIHPGAAVIESDFVRSWARAGRESQARNLLAARLGFHAAVVLLGMGAEGVVLQRGDRVVKLFDRWTISQRRVAAPLLAELLEKPTSGALPTPLAVHDWPEAFAVEYKFDESEPYTGGRGQELLAMLQYLRRSGWVHSNISPKNLRITRQGLQLVDVGKSLEHATPLGEEMMIRRAFLAWRFAGRDNLVQLMRTSLSTEHLAELTGWRALLEAVREPPSKARLDRYIRARLEALHPQRLLDYGCGKPRDLASELNGCQITAFDIDPTLGDRWQRDAPHVRFWGQNQIAAAMIEEERFDVVICSLVLCAVDDPTMYRILENLWQTSRTGGRVIAAVCDPAAIHLTHAADQTRLETTGLDPALPARYLKCVGGSATSREEHHRSIESYRRAFARAGLRVSVEHSVGGFDAENLERAPEFLVFELEPLPKLSARTSLLIKLCAMEADSALHQVRHLERQLGRPRGFDEIVALVDLNEGPFPRPHSPADLPGLRRAIARLQAEGIIDRVVDGFVDGPSAAEVARRWTDCDAHKAHCANGQPATAILAAMEACTGDYILHVDADVLISRSEPNFDHIAEAIGLFEETPDVVTLALPVCGDLDEKPRRDTDKGPFRVEAICGWISKRRLLGLRPLRGGAQAGQLKLPWHRMVDMAVKDGFAASLRRGSHALWFAAADNLRKAGGDAMDLLMERVEAGFFPRLQTGQPLISGAMSEWVGPKRQEDMVVVICGRNVRPGAVERCFASLRAQSCQHWGAIVIDDASDEPCHEAIKRQCGPLGGRVTLLHRHRRVGLLANTFLAVRELVQYPKAVIVLLDLDDALADPEALSIVADTHREGADLTVGSMVRTDKPAFYPVNFTDPRGNRGGNVWQHLRTFRKSLFDRIRPADLKLDESWVELANDWAYMLPMVEMAKNPVWLRKNLYLHEPSTARQADEKATRETVVSRLIAKPSYRTQSGVKPHVTILCYHRILEELHGQGVEAVFHQQGMVVTAATLRAQLAQILREFEPIRISDLLAAQRGERALPDRALLVTVDDGYRDFAEYGLPLMKHAGIEPVLFARKPATDGLPSWAPLDLLYVGRGMIGAETPFPDPSMREKLLQFPLSQQISEVEKSIGMALQDLTPQHMQLYLSEAELRDLQGFVLGIHGVDHIRWTRLDNASLDMVLSRCRAWLENMGSNVRVAAYPDGDLDQRVAGRLAQHGFDAAFAINSIPDNIPPAFAWKRIIMKDDPHQVDRLLSERQENAA